MYIKYSNLVGINNITLVGLITLSVCLILALVNSYLLFALPSKNPNTADICMGMPYPMKLVWYNYVSANHKPTVVLAILAIGMLFTITELAIYLDICRTLYAHDQSMKWLLPQNALVQRNKKNALNLAGHMFSFLLDSLLMVMATLNTHVIQSNTAKLVVPILALSHFGINPLVVTLLSKTLRNELLILMDRIFLIPQVTKLLRFLNLLGMFQSLTRKIVSFRSTYT